MERGEIWLVSLDPTAGHEQQGTRPVLIVTPAAFNRVTRLPVVVPVTSGGNFARTAGFAVSLDGVGIRTTGVVRCDQPRTIDMKARGGKRLERVPETIMTPSYTKSVSWQHHHTGIRLFPADDVVLRIKVGQRFGFKMNLFRTIGNGKAKIM